MRRALIVLGLLLAAGCGESGPGPDGKGDGGPPRGAVDDEGRPAKEAPPVFSLSRQDDGSLVWNAPRGYLESVTILFDNGLPEPVTVAMSESERFQVAPDSHVFLRSPPTALRIRVFDASGALIDRADFQPESGAAYVCNPGAAWDYCVTTAIYSSRELPGPGTESVFPRARSFFCAGRVTHWFEKVPDEVTGWVEEGEDLIDSRTSLNRLDRDTTRTVKIVEGEGGAALRLIAAEDLLGPWTSVQRMDETGIEMHRVYVLCMLEEPARLLVDGVPIRELGYYEDADLRFEGGVRRLTAVAESGERYERDVDTDQEDATFEIEAPERDD